jgi:MFS transporter, DHA2 family, multidrug resistance protein
MDRDGLPLPQRHWSMLAIALGISTAALDSAIANVALPTMSKELGATPADSVWIVNAYQLAIVVALLPIASLGECIGYRRIYLGGLVFFTVGSFLFAIR